jgi:hypothetical protein
MASIANEQLVIYLPDIYLIFTWNSSRLIYRVYKKKRNLGISQEIDIVLKTKDFRRLGI